MGKEDYKKGLLDDSELTKPYYTKERIEKWRKRLQQEAEKHLADGMQEDLQGKERKCTKNR